MDADWLVVGSGLTGATIARILADAGHRVLVLERRGHAGGNVHESIHASGMPFHTYGPHYFRTNDEALWRFVHRFAGFRRFEAQVRTRVGGTLEAWPPTPAAVGRLAGPGWRPSFDGTPANFEEAALAKLPRPAYEAFVRGYTEKQWGCAARTLSPRLAARFELGSDRDPRLSRHRFQGLPEHGYTRFMQSLLDGIEVRLGVDWLKARDAFRATQGVVYTGPLDEFFGFDLGRLGWRGQRREHEWIDGAGFVQPCVQVNDPSSVAHVRTIEWKHLLSPADAARMPGTLLTREIPYTPADPAAFEYPFPDDANARLHDAYRARAEAIPRFLACGRLGEYRYLDMDQAIARAMVHANRLLGRAG